MAKCVSDRVSAILTAQIILKHAVGDRTCEIKPWTQHLQFSQKRVSFCGPGPIRQRKTNTLFSFVRGHSFGVSDHLKETNSSIWLCSFSISSASLCSSQRLLNFECLHFKFLRLTTNLCQVKLFELSLSRLPHTPTRLTALMILPSSRHAAAHSVRSPPKR